MQQTGLKASPWAYLFLAPYLLLFGVFLLLPLGFGSGLSFFRYEMLSPFPTRFIGLANYREALASEDFWRAAWATLRFVALAVPLNAGVALLIALGVHSIQNRRQALYRALFFLPTIISISVVGILWRWFYNSEFGLFNALLAPLGLKLPWITETAWAMKSIVLMTLWWTVGSTVVILIAGLGQIPPQYYEAALIDGARAPQRLRYITLPLLRPVMLFVIVMSTISSFQVFGQTFIITRGGPEFSTRVLVQYIYETSFMFYRMGYGAAMSWLLCLPIVLCSFVFFRLMRER